MGRVARGLALALAVFAHGWATAATGAEADFRGVAASPQALAVARWAVRSDDHAGRPFAIIDKLQSRVFVFDAGGQLLGEAPALIGLAPGDRSVPGIGTRKLSSVLPHERTTPAGRFVASLDRSLQGDDILWVDYESGVALHRVVAGVPRERRMQRLASPVPGDRRITFGCINVAVPFFDAVVAPAFRGQGGIVYVLPESRSLAEVFGLVEAPAAVKGP